MHQGFVHLDRERPAAELGKLWHLQKDLEMHCFISYGGCTTMKAKVSKLGDGFKHFLFSSLFGEDSHVD